jgi:hypothetical protein
MGVPPRELVWVTHSNARVLAWMFMGGVVWTLTSEEETVLPPLPKGFTVTAGISHWARGAPATVGTFCRAIRRLKAVNPKTKVSNTVKHKTNTLGLILAS